MLRAGTDDAVGVACAGIRDARRRRHLAVNAPGHAAHRVPHRAQCGRPAQGLDGQPGSGRAGHPRPETAGNHASAACELPGLNHLFQTAGTGLINEYGSIEETMAPVALQAISDWITTQTAVKR
jgi:hypothetical protein